MKAFIATALLAAASGATATRVAYALPYGSKDTRLTDTSCGSGTNGLTTKYGWQTIGDIPAKYVGGASDINKYNSDQCGNCYRIDYNSKTVYMLAIDFAGNGLNIAQGGLDELTNGNAYNLGTIDATVTKVDTTFCLTGH
ncbi:Cerato-platanin [Teratosphaeria destructans]|uniref:Cerato-platanin n=1 Tax=Teratosphaeria destructans TaxID=418781 RepID=A0A9W7W5H5_9PEZI|nr:Cerato-platanin [Teratosphaeria destructans]